MEPLWAELINSDWRDYRGSGRREDRLASDDWLALFLARCGWRRTRRPSVADRVRLRRLRATLRRMVDALRAGRPVAPGDLATLNRTLAAGSWVPRLERQTDGWRVATRASARGIRRVEAEVAHSFAALLGEGDPTRLRVCANPDCGWVMYDQSRNRTRQWCEARECGNLIKVRRFRQRQRAARVRAERAMTRPAPTATGQRGQTRPRDRRSAPRRDSRARPSGVRSARGAGRQRT
jgi:predicted RNA-binding Zn ribbon-like protein